MSGGFFRKREEKRGAFIGQKKKESAFGGFKVKDQKNKGQKNKGQKNIDILIDILKKQFTEIEKRDDLTEDEKVSQIIHRCSFICSVVAIQPLPFADIFLLTPIQLYMGSKIASLRKVPVSEADVKDLVKKIGSVLGLAYSAQQTALGLYKIGLPFLGGFMTIPLVFGLTYAIGRIMDYYLHGEKTGKTENVKDLFRRALKEGKTEGKANIQKIKKYMEEFFTKTGKNGEDDGENGENGGSGTVSPSPSSPTPGQFKPVGGEKSASDKAG